MKAQTRIGSLTEAAQNILVGYGISVVATYTIGPLFHMHPGVGDVLGFGGVMTLISIARSYGLRRWNEHKRGKSIPPDFLHIAEELAAERWKQITREGFTLDHDDQQDNGEIAAGAAAYCLASIDKMSGIAAVTMKQNAVPGSRVDAIRKAWNWGHFNSPFKPTIARGNLIKAGAMIIAEIGRLDRAARNNSPNKRHSTEGAST